MLRRGTWVVGRASCASAGDNAESKKDEDGVKTAAGGVAGESSTRGGERAAPRLAADYRLLAARVRTRALFTSI